MASSRSFLDWPFFGDSHRELASRLDEWAAAHFAGAAKPEDRESVDAASRQLVRDLGRGGWTRHCVPQETARAAGAEHTGFDVRSLALIREILARHDALADFAFAMQGLGSGAISIAGSPELKARYLPRVVAGDAIAAFALSEPDAGSDVAALRCRATRTPTDTSWKARRPGSRTAGLRTSTAYSRAPAARTFAPTALPPPTGSPPSSWMRRRRACRSRSVSTRSRRIRSRRWPFTTARCR